VFRLPTPRLFSGLKSALRPAMPRFKVSAFWLLILAWIFLLVWIWWKGPTWTLYEEQWLKPLANRWLATAAWGIIALVWLTVRVMKRLQQLEKQQKQQREEAIDPLSVELNAQQRYLDRWLLRLQRHLDNRRFLWQLPWYMVIGRAVAKRHCCARGFRPTLFMPRRAHAAQNNACTSRPMSVNRR
jgi:type VI secretion system protein ImpL